MPQFVTKPEADLLLEGWRDDWNERPDDPSCEGILLVPCQLSHVRISASQLSQ